MESLHNLTTQQWEALFDEDLPWSNTNNSISSSIELNPVQTCYKRLAKQSNNVDDSSVSGRPSKKSDSTLDHTIAERKRRATLSQHFITLSTIIPGLKKIDKGSILESSILYTKQLQERLKELEEQVSEKTIESAVYVKRSQTHEDSGSFPEIAAKVSGRNVLIRIHCEKHKGILMKMIMETEKLNLCVVSSSLIPLGSSTMDITIMAEMNSEFNVTTTELVKCLNAALVGFVGNNIRIKSA
ncbi:hypothetical protein ACHQM5_015330 [Ranunculus cassubicifolius]